jgi:hypothetical protein
MRTALFAAVILLPFIAAMFPASAQETKPNAQFHIPTVVSDLLDACGETVKQVDNHLTQNSAANLMKIGWCLGWAQPLQERIVEVHAYARFEDMTGKKEGGPPRAYEGPDKDYLSVCLPPESRSGGLIRTMARELGHSLPNTLTEPKNGPVKAAQRRAYPGPAPASTPAVPDTKP